MLFHLEYKNISTVYLNEPKIYLKAGLQKVSTSTIQQTSFGKFNSSHLPLLPLLDVLEGRAGVWALDRPAHRSE